MPRHQNNPPFHKQIPPGGLEIPVVSFKTGPKKQKPPAVPPKSRWRTLKAHLARARVQTDEPQTPRHVLQPSNDHQDPPMAGKKNLWNDLPMAVLGLFASHWKVLAEASGEGTFHEDSLQQISTQNPQTKPKSGAFLNAQRASVGPKPGRPMARGKKMDAHPRSFPYASKALALPELGHLRGGVGGGCRTQRRSGTSVFFFFLHACVSVVDFGRRSVTICVRIRGCSGVCGARNVPRKTRNLELSSD